MQVGCRSGDTMPASIAEGRHDLVSRRRGGLALSVSAARFRAGASTLSDRDHCCRSRMYEHLSILPVPPRKSKGSQPLGRVPAPKRESDPAFWKFQGRYGRAARSRCRSRSQRQQGEMSRRQHAPARFKVAGQRARLRDPIAAARSHHKGTSPPSQRAGARVAVAAAHRFATGRDRVATCSLHVCRPA